MSKNRPRLRQGAGSLHTPGAKGLKAARAGRRRYRPHPKTPGYQIPGPSGPEFPGAQTYPPQWLRNMRACGFEYDPDTGGVGRTGNQIALNYVRAAIGPPLLSRGGPTRFE
jgi:hypothetical protein